MGKKDRGPDNYPTKAATIDCPVCGATIVARTASELGWKLSEHMSSEHGG